MDFKADFQFKQFAIEHKRCAMKVNTDGILLGGWVKLNNPASILDIGCGSGLITLMLAQRTEHTQITAIDIDEGAIEQSNINVQQSPWAKRINVQLQDFLTWQTEQTFDVIVSNPPFFSASLGSPDQQRQKARHNDILPFEKLLQTAKQRLSPKGEFSVIIPESEFAQFSHLAQKVGFYLQRNTQIKTTPNKNVSRRLLTYKVNKDIVEERDTLIIRDKDNHYTKQYQLLLKDFYLKM